MSKKSQRPPDGELRQNQLLTTFGPGSMVDLPNRSVIISGLTFWRGEKQPIREERLAYKIARKLNPDDPQPKPINLYTPPQQSNDPQAPKTGIDAFIFPTWFVAQVNKTIEIKGKTYRTRPLVPWRLVKEGFKFEGRRVQAVPIRFVQACPNGHLSDIDWNAFIHGESSSMRGRLWLDEAGSGNDFEEIFIRCEQTGKRRPLAQAKLKDSKVLGFCKGHRPWLGRRGKEDCRKYVVDDQGNITATNQPEYNRLLIRSASNAYFTQLLSVITMPDQEADLRRAVDRFYEEDLQYAEDLSDIRKELKKPKFADLAAFGPDAVWEEIRRRKSGLSAPEKSIKQVELEALLSCPEEMGKEPPPKDKTFHGLTRRPSQLETKWELYIDKVVLVHRLREVMALIGFTRFEATLTNIEGEIDDELAINVRRADLDFENNWVPAVENLGEGVFISFKKDAIETWLSREPVKQRAQALSRGYFTWAESRGIPRSKIEFPGAPYILLHSLSHLLITAVSLECGYTSSAIRERIYISKDTGYGILLHTGTSGSEGTLGGLVEVGRNIEHHLGKALEYGRLCSNDPVCAKHEPDNLQEDRFLHGAACHGCLLIAETSCERRNELLDRSLVVNTVENLGAEFFPEGLF